MQRLQVNFPSTDRARKSQLRSHFRQLRSSWLEGLRAKPDLRQQTESATTEALLAWSLQKHLSRAPLFWGVYAAQPEELNLSHLWQMPRASSPRFAFACLSGQSLVFCEPARLDNFAQWPRNRFGIAEPKEAVPVAIERLSCVLVPGLAFDEFGGRLGQGQGYYDRALASYQGPRVGVAWSVQMSTERLPVEAHDIKMTHLVCEHGVREITSTPRSEKD